MDLFRWDGWPTASEWQAFWSFITAGVAAAAAIIALGHYRTSVRSGVESVNNRIEQARPFVVVDLRFLGGLYACVDVTNSGLTAARNIKFKWSEHPVAIDDKSQMALDRAMVDGDIPFLAPGRTISYMLNQYDDDEPSQDVPRRYAIKATYNGPADDVWDSESVLDVDQWAATLVQRSQHADITDELKKLVAAAQSQKQADEALARAADSVNVHLESGFRVQMARKQRREQMEARWAAEEGRSTLG